MPTADELDVGELGSQWAEAEARAACWMAGYFELVGIADEHDAAWEAYADAPR